MYVYVIEERRWVKVGKESLKAGNRDVFEKCIRESVDIQER